MPLSWKAPFRERLGVYTFIINAAAGRGRGAKVRPTIERFMATAGKAHRFAETTSPEAATQASLEAARDGHVVVAVGGDGSIHHVFRGLVQAMEAAEVLPTLGVLPVGTGNDLARMLGLSRVLEESLSTLIHGRIRSVDYGTVEWEGVSDSGRRPFINVAGIGLDAHSARLAVKLKPYLGNLCYTVSPALSAWVWKSPEATIKLDDGRGGDEVWTNKFLLASVANGKWVGGGITISPDAEIDDGLLDLCLVRAVNPIRALTILPQAVKGSHTKLDEVKVRTFSRMSVSVSSPCPIHLDGEPCSVDALSALFAVSSKRLRVVAPEPS